MKTQFICEKCGKTYATAEDAKECEANHGVLIEAHPMPGASYHHGKETAAEYKFFSLKDNDFSVVKKERGCNE